MDELNEKSVKDVKKLQKEVTRSWWEDGIHEMLSGLLFLLVGSGNFIDKFYGQHSYLSMIGKAMIVLGVFTLVLLRKYFKAKYSWAKVGYAIPRINYPIPSIITMAMAVLVFFAFIIFSGKFDGILYGAFTSLLFLTVYFATGFKRFLVISAVPLIVGIILFLFNIEIVWAILSILLFTTGIALLISGLKVFRNFGRRHDE